MLTREQIQANITALEKQGAKPQEIQAWLDSLKTSSISNKQSSQSQRSFSELEKNKERVVGVGKGIVKTFKGMSSLGERGLQFLTGGIKKEPTSAEQLIPKNTYTASNKYQQQGITGEQIAEYFIPGSASLKVGKAAQTAVGAGKLAQTVAKFGATGLAEGVLGTGQSAMQSGRIGNEELKAGAISLAAPAVLATTGRLLNKVATPIKTKIIENIRKAVKPSVKSIKTPGYMEKATRAFQIMKNNQIEFPDGIRNPKTVSETFDVLKNAKKSIYNRYNSIAEQSGELGYKFSPRGIMADLSNWGKGTGYSSEVKEYAGKRIAQLADLEGATPVQIQDRIQELNSGVNIFTSGSEKLKHQIDASIASALRKQLDDIIANTTGQPYQALKNDYGALKAIEDDLARTAGNLARRGEKGLIDFTDIFTGADLATGILTANPSSFARGLVGRVIKEYDKYLNSPNKAVRELFKLIEKLPEPKSGATPTQKLLNAGTPGKSSSNVPIRLGAKAPSTIEAEEIKRIQAGLKTKGVASPKTALGGLEQEARKYKSAEEFVNAQSKLYRGSDIIEEDIKISKGEDLSFGDGIYLSDNKNIAKEYGKNITEIIPDKTLKLRTISQTERQNLVELFGSEQKDYINKLLGDKYNGLRIPERAGDGFEIVVYDKSAIKTKSQLTDIWKKANAYRFLKNK